VCGRVSAAFGHMGKKDAAVRIAVLRDLGDLAPRAPCRRRGIDIRALLVDRVTDRFGNTLIKTVWKQDIPPWNRNNRTKKNALPGMRNALLDSMKNDLSATTLLGSWRSGSLGSYTRA
jgi:hypothetical protein